MRSALLTAAAVIAAGMVVPTTATALANAPVTTPDTTPNTVPTLAVSGTLLPIHHEIGPDSVVLATGDGRLVPVSLDGRDAPESPRTFRGELAITPTVERRAEARGATIDPGDTVAATSADGTAVLGAAAAGTTALPVAEATLTTPRTAAGATTSTHRLYLAVITNRGTVESDSAIAAKSAQMRSYWTTESDGDISSFTQPTATVKYATSVSGCGLDDPSPMWNEAAGKFPGVNFNSAGNHLMVLVPDDCGSGGAAGIGTVGSSLGSGGWTTVSLGGTAVAIGVHELGHNLSLQHANAEQCASTCSTEEYWDLYSIMGLAVGGGSWTPPALDTAYRVRTGIASGTEVPTVTSSGTIHLEGRGTGSGTRGLLVTDPSSGVKYAVEYRSGAGRDATAFYANRYTIGGYSFRPGVVVERMESGGSTTMMTRQSGSTTVTSYLPGETFSRGQVTIAVTAASPSDGADLAVTIGTPPPGTPPTSTPVGTLRPGVPRVVGVARVGYRLTVTTSLWSPQPSSYRVQWLKDGDPLPGATARSLVVPRSAYGSRISVRVTGYRTGYTSASATSAATAPIARGRFSTRTVTISGRAEVGRTLAAKTGSWQPRPSLSYRWYANGRAVAKATGRTLKVTRSLRGKIISVKVTARQYGYEPASRVSSRTRVR